MRRHSLTRSGIVKGVGTAGNARVEQEELFRPVDRDVFVHDLNRQLGIPSH